MKIDLKGLKILVTGAGQGIGRALAEELARDGAIVYALSKTEAKLLELKKQNEAINIICCDLTDLNATRKGITHKLDELFVKHQVSELSMEWNPNVELSSACAVEPHLPFHCLVNNAGVAFLEQFVDITEEAYDKCMDVNLKSVLFLSQLVCKSMVDNKIKGSVVHVSSQASKIALNNHTVYCTSKAALDMLCKSMALELGPHGIRVNCVNPTVVFTEMGKKNWSDPQKAAPLLNRTPLGHFAKEEDVTNAVMFLLSDKAAMTTGSFFPIDGGRLCT